MINIDNANMIDWHIRTKIEEKYPWNKRFFTEAELVGFIKKILNKCVLVEKYKKVTCKINGGNFVYDIIGITTVD
jgi:hypothetical protein